MSIKQTIILYVGQAFFVIGFFLVGIYGLISYNQNKIEYLIISIGAVFLVSGWYLMQNICKTTGKNLAEVLMKLIPRF